MPEEEIKVDFKSTKESLHKISEFFKRKKVITILSLSILLLIVIIGVVMRLQNLPLLVDHTTGQYVPQLELDAFYWLREATTILHTGSLPAVDTIRVGAGNIPYSSELLPYILVDVYKLVHMFNGSITLNFIDVIYPVIAFGLGLIIFFFLVYKLTRSKLTAIISALFLTVIPTYLYRTTAGFADHDALGIFVFFSVLLVFAISLVWLNKKDQERKIKSNKLLISILFGAAIGFLTALAIATWGGISLFIPMILPLGFFIFWLIKIKDLETEKKELPKFLLFYISFALFSLIFALMFNFSLGDVLHKIFINPTSFLLGFVLLFSIFDFLIIKFMDKIPVKSMKKHHILWAILLSGLIGLLIIAVQGSLSSFISNISTQIVSPFGTDRLTVTVAEDRQTFATDWISQVGNIFFWLFFAGLITLGINLSKSIKEKKGKIGFVLVWILLISGLLLSRFSQSSPILGGGFFSDLFLFGSIAIFLIYCLIMYSKHHLEMRPEMIVLLSTTIIMLIAANTAAYIMSIVSPFACIFVGYLIFNLGSYFKSSKDDLLKMFLAIILIVVLILATISFYNLSSTANNQAKNTGIGSYGAQWDAAMAWVRDNTPVNAIFVHWWDYGYIVEYLGQRATLSDGGHFEGTFRDSLIGRYVLTETDPNLALSFMKSNNVSYLLIDPTDLGKYAAYSLIGSDASLNDRVSSVQAFVSDPTQTQTINNTTTRIYQNVVPTDQDILYNTSQGQVFIPQGQAYVIGLILSSNQSNSADSSISFSQPEEVVYYSNQQIRIPLRYLYFNNKLVDFGSGYAGAAYVLPTLGQNAAGTTQIDSFGSVIYLSPKVFGSLFAQLYLMNDPLNEYPTVKLALSQDDSILQSLKAQGFTGDFIYYNGFDGPIKIWNTAYPSNILSKVEFTQTSGVYGGFDNLTVTA